MRFICQDSALALLNADSEGDKKLYMKYFILHHLSEVFQFMIEFLQNCITKLLSAAITKNILRIFIFYSFIIKLLELCSI